ncbi:MAG TPA: hypothetical protein VJR30_07540 [Bradyrhizobium sp.]|nr:hypothetical protein [Bradyrhizobium sp.]
MNIGFDHETCKGARAADEEFGGFPTAPDWTDLRARMFAAHEVRTVLSCEADRMRLRTRGSFAGGTASLLNSYETGSSPVNLEISTNLKPGAVKITSVAGADKTGERG